MEITSSSRVALPRYRPRAAREVASAITFDARKLRTTELTYDPEGLLVLLHLDLKLADIFELGRNVVARLLANRRHSDPGGKAQSRRNLDELPHFWYLR